MSGRVYNIKENEIKTTVFRLDVALNKFLANFSPEQQNQILKAKDNGVYLFLDETFTVDEFRNIRRLFSKENPLLQFINNYSERIIDDTKFAYEYDIKYTEKKNLIVIELINKIKQNNILYSKEFENKIFDLKENKKAENIFLSKVYMERFPFSNQEEINDIKRAEYHYINHLLSLEMYSFNRFHNKLHTKLLYGKINEIQYVKEITNLKAKRSVVYSLSRKLDEKEALLESELITLNNIINKQKYNILANIKYWNKLNK